MPTSYEHQINFIIERFGFTFTKSEIKSVIGIYAASKKALIREVLESIEGNEQLKDKLNDLGLLSLQLDTRQIELFNISNLKVVKNLKRFFEKVQITDVKDFLNSFPFPIEKKSVLNRLKTGKIHPILSDSVVLNKNIYQRVVLSTIIEKEIEEEVPISHLSEAGLREHSANTIYTMKKKVRTQLFHAIYWCETNSKLILSVDKNAITMSITHDQLFVLKQFLMESGVDTGAAINVFGAIEPLYKSRDGCVTKIGHVTTDGNPVRIPLKGRQRCLKEDNYHKVGEGQGFVHAKFAVAKKWEFKLEETGVKFDVEVGLNGQPRMLDTAQPLTDFTISRTKRLEDFSFAIDKVLSHLNKNSQLKAP